MTRPSRNTDQLLLNAAKELLPKTGFTGLSIRQVSKKAGVNLGMFNYHFKTREAFMQRLLSDMYEEFFRDFTIEVQSGANSLEQLRNAILHIALFARENRQILATLIEDVMTGNEAIVEFVRKNMTRHVAVIIKLVKQCQKDGYIVKMSLFNLLPVMLASVVGPNVILRLIEKHAIKRIELKVLYAIASRQILSDKAIKQRLDIVFKGLAPA